MGYKKCNVTQCAYTMSDEHNQFSIGNANVRSKVSGNIYEREVIGCIWRCPKCGVWQGIEMYSQDEWEFI